MSPKDVFNVIINANFRIHSMDKQNCVETLEAIEASPLLRCCLLDRHAFNRNGFDRYVIVWPLVVVLTLTILSTTS